MIMRLLVLLSVLVAVHSNVIGLDFGSDAMKVAIVQPGAPLEIGMNIPTDLDYYGR